MDVSVRFWTTSTRAQLLWLDDWVKASSKQQVLCGVPVEQCLVSTKSNPKRGNRKNWQTSKSQHVLQRPTDLCEEQRLAPLIKSQWKFTITQIANRSLLRMGPCWRWLVRVPALIPVHRLQHCQRACEHQDWTLVQRNYVVWSEEPCEGPGRRKRWHQDTL